MTETGRPDGPTFVQIQTTTGSREEADHIALGLVEARMAACVQVLGPITSVYRWDGAIHREEEWLCTIKTRQDMTSRVMARIAELHSYDVPEVITLPIVDGSPAYIDWLEQVIDSHPADAPV